MVVDEIGDNGLLSMTFLDPNDMKRYWKADTELERRFDVVLVHCGDEITFNLKTYTVALPWIMEKLLAVA